MISLEQSRQQKIPIGPCVNATDLSTTETVAYNAAGMDLAIYKGAERTAITPTDDDRGDELWSDDHGTTVNAIAVDSDGNVVIGGGVTGGTSVRYYNSSGVEQWDADHGATVLAVAFDADGDVYIGGARTGDVSVRKYNSSGVEQWTYDTGDRARAIVAHDDMDTIVVAGTDVEGEGVWALAQSDGTEEWAGEMDDYGMSLAVSPDFDSIYVGTTGDEVLRFVHNDTYTGLLRNRWDTGGTVYALAVDSDGNLYARCAGSIVQYGPYGEEIWETDVDDVIRGIAVDGNDIIWCVQDRGAETVTYRAFNTDGEELFTDDHGADLDGVAADDDAVYIAGAQTGGVTHRKLSLGNHYWEEVNDGTHRLTLSAADTDNPGPARIVVNTDTIQPVTEELHIYTPENYEAMITGDSLGLAAERVDVDVSSRAMEAGQTPKPRREIEPMVSVTLDDIPLSEEYLAICEEYEFFVTNYIVTNNMATTDPDRYGPISDEDLAKLVTQQETGHENGAHSHTHPKMAKYGTEHSFDEYRRALTPAEIHEEFQLSNAVLREAGLTIHNWAIPHSYYNDDVLKIASQYYRSTRSLVGEDRFPDEHVIERAGLNFHPLSSFAYEGVGDRSDAEEYIDEIETDGAGWLILLSHEYNWDSDDYDDFELLIQYIQERDIPILTVDAALDRITGERGAAKEAWDYDMSDYEDTAAGGSQAADMIAAIRAGMVGRMDIDGTTVTLYGVDGVTEIGTHTLGDDPLARGDLS